MGCAASTSAAVSSHSPAIKPVSLTSGNDFSNATATAAATGAATPQEQQQHTGEQQAQATEPGSPGARPTALDRVKTFGAEGRAQELESPNIRSAAVKKKREEATDDSIPTILTEDFDDDEADTPLTAPVPTPAAKSIERQQDSEEEEDSVSSLPSLRPQRSESPTTRRSPQQPLPHGSNRTTPVKPTVQPSALSESQELEHLAPPSASPARGTLSLLGLEGVEAKRPTSQVPTLPPLQAPAPAGHGRLVPGRYDDITLSDDDDDDGAHGFDIERWRRFYKWNRTKPLELSEFLWRRFDPKHYSIFCATYKAQGNIFAGFQGENIVHGLCCRMERLRTDLFASFNTYYSSRTDSYKVVGVFIIKGSELPSDLRALPDFSEFQFLKADTKDVAVRKFVDCLISRTAPGPDLSPVYSQEYPKSDKL